MTETIQNARAISAADVRKLCGGISDMTIWRWMNERDEGFPRPFYIGKRRYWREHEVLAWLDKAPKSHDNPKAGFKSKKKQDAEQETIEVPAQKKPVWTFRQIEINKWQVFLDDKHFAYAETDAILRALSTL